MKANRSNLVDLIIDIYVPESSLSPDDHRECDKSEILTIDLVDESDYYLSSEYI